MKKYDIYLASAMFFIALVLYLIIRFSFAGGKSLQIYKDNALINEYSLQDEGVFSVEDNDHILMTFKISDGKVDVLSADCRDKLCVHQKAISLSSEMICCLPNKIILMINDESSENEEYDAVTK